MEHNFTLLKPLFIFFHLIGLVMGLGGAIVGDILFFRFLKDLRISKKESEVLHYVSQIVVIGLFILAASGTAIFLSDPARYMVSSKFVTKMIIVLVIAINGFALHKILAPKLMDIEWNRGTAARHRPLRKLAFALGAISSSSWFVALLLGSLSSIPFSTAIALAMYAGLLVIAVSTSQIMEAYYTKYLDTP